MRVALVAPGGFHPSGRVCVIPALLALAERLAARHRLDVFVPESGAPYSLRGAVVHPVGERYRDLGPALRSGAPIDVLHAVFADAAYPAMTRALRIGVPCVVSIGGGELAALPEIGFGGALTMRGRVKTALTLLLADAVTVGSRFAAADLPAWVDARRVPLGIDAALFDAGPERPPGPPWRLLHVASLNAVKDQRMLLTAFALASAEEDMSLDVAGEDTLDGAMKGLAESLGLSTRVTFHGFLENESLVPLYRAAHLHVLSSRYESQAVVVSEAAAASLPTVGTAVGVLPELAPAAAAAVAPGDAAALAAALVSLLRDEPRRHAMGRAARSWARAHDAAATAAAFEAIYREVARP